ncbi:MAG: redox-sensing transcriptional repressor Rex [Planctomycetaceae bacterium]|jgi:redox-sensing transcriptional repressor|nr:redox-sensing transcriptional repressor Rex [Planctomycetaceae bacterium]
MFPLNYSPPSPSIRRLPIYLRFAKQMRDKGQTSLSCAQISLSLGGLAVQIRKDLAMTGLQGKPKIGYPINNMIESIEKFLGWDEPVNAILIGVGHVGEAILTYQVLYEFGLRITAAFSDNPDKIGKTIGYTPVFPSEKLDEEGSKANASICILATSGVLVQEATDLSLKIKSIRAIWNFAPVRPFLPPHIEYEEIRLGGSLALLTNKLKRRSRNAQS